MNVSLTVDVESYTGNYGREIYGDGLGLDYVLSKCIEFGCRATFFVEAMAATRWGNSGLERLCHRIAEAGQDVQLHVHPVIALMDGFEDRDDILWRHSGDEQKRLIETGLTVLADCGMGSVSVFRAGDFAADEATLVAMKQCGLSVGSNRDLDMKSSIRTRLNDSFPIKNDLSARDGIVDLPVSVLRSPFAFLDGDYRHMEIAAMGAGEMCDGLARMSAVGYRCATILTHADEFFRSAGGNLQPVRKNRRRLETLLEFVTRRSDLRMLPVGDCVAQTDEQRLQPEILRANPFYSFVRVLQQARERLRRRR